MTNTTDRPSGAPTVTHLNPAGLPVNPFFSQAVIVDGDYRTVHIGGQNAVREDGSVDGDTLGAQTVRTLENIKLVLAAAGATPADVVSWTIHALDDSDIPEALTAFSTAWDMTLPMPAINVVLVSRFGRPEYLLEISAIAVTAVPGR